MRGGHRVRSVGAKSKASSWGWIAAGILLVLSVAALWWLLGLPGTSRTPLDSAERGGNLPPGEDLSLWFASPTGRCVGIGETPRASNPDPD